MTIKTSSQGLRGLGALAEIQDGWNILPSTSGPQRAVPQNATRRRQGQNFSEALNASLAAARLEGQVQNDGVISLFHIEMFGRLLGKSPVAASAFSDANADLVLANQQEGLLELVLEDGFIEEATSRLRVVASTIRKASGSSSMSTTAKVGIVAGSVAGILLLRKMYA